MPKFEYKGGMLGPQSGTFLGYGITRLVWLVWGTSSSAQAPKYQHRSQLTKPEVNINYTQTIGPKTCQRSSPNQMWPTHRHDRERNESSFPCLYLQRDQLYGVSFSAPCHDGKPIRNCFLWGFPTSVTHPSVVGLGAITQSNTG